eukprot:TRINITY_DN25726_c0_g1_i1.p1 TRINITY_DN25726_c0_g1~~TRINITY_DN25726_c0_g1_i1.p1  ORF type:complete len:426 (+),score=93.37 TRINITY_DN25726_c0_g1_i1:75-1352(+)
MAPRSVLVRASVALSAAAALKESLEDLLGRRDRSLELAEQLDDELSVLFGEQYASQAGHVDGSDEPSNVHWQTTGTALRTLLQEAVPGGLTADDVWYDLGAGTGKAVLLVFLLSSVKQAVGIEWEASQHLAAKPVIPGLVDSLQHRDAAAIQARQLRGAPLVLGWREAHGREVRLEQGDMFDVDWEDNDASVVFTASLSFPEPMLLRLSEMLAELRPGTLVLSLHEIGGCHPGLALLRKATISAGPSSETVPVHAYIVTPGVLGGSNTVSPAWLSAVLMQDEDAVRSSKDAWSRLADTSSALSLQEFVYPATEELQTTKACAKRLYEAALELAGGGAGAGGAGSLLGADAYSWLLLHRQRGSMASALECAAVEWSWEVSSNPIGLPASTSTTSRQRPPTCCSCFALRSFCDLLVSRCLGFSTAVR